LSTLPTINELVLRQLEVDPDISLKACISVVPGLKKSNFYKIKKEWKEGSGRVDKKQKNHDPFIKRGRGSLAQPPSEPHNTITKDELKGLSIKAKLKLLGETVIDNYILSGKEPRVLPKAIDLLSDKEFIEQGEVKHGVFWTSNIQPYNRPWFVYKWQTIGIDIMKDTHTMWQASRQKIGKTTGAFMADFEDMLENPGTVVTLVAPGMEQATVLLRQGFKEVLTLDDGTKFDLWNQLYKPYFLIDNVKKMVMKNGSILQVIPLSEYTTPGYATDILHIEELDKVVKDPQKIRALGAVLPTIRARRGFAKLRITCNNTSGVYRILREDLKDLYPHVAIYMEKPRPLDSEFTGEHFMYNEHYNCKEKPDIDVILQRIMDVVMGEEYSRQQLGNLDDYSGDTFNPDKLDLAYSKGKEFRPREYYSHVVLSIDPGAVHDFAASIYGKEGVEFFHLYTETFTVSGKTEIESEKMLKTIAKKLARQYVDHHCEVIVSESNSGAKLIVPLINHYIRKEIAKRGGSTYAQVNDPIWSNWGADKGQGQEDRKLFSRVDYITLMQVILDFENITFQDRNKHEHKQRVEFARYDPVESVNEKYKGNCVDSSLHAVWYLGKGHEYIEKVSGMADDEEEAYTL